MEMHVQHNKDTSIIIIDKDKLFGAENKTFQTLIQDLIEDGSKNISVDLSNVKLITSLAIESFIHACAYCKVKNVNFVLKNVNVAVKNVLSTLRLTDLIKIN